MEKNFLEKKEQPKSSYTYIDLIDEVLSDFV